MANDNIVAEIRRRRIMGEPKVNIEQALSIQGWTPAEIDEAFVAAAAPVDTPSPEKQTADPRLYVDGAVKQGSKKAPTIIGAAIVAACAVGLGVYSMQSRSSMIDIPQTPVACSTDVTADDESDYQKMASIEKEIAQYSTSDSSIADIASSSGAELDAQLTALARQGEKADKLQTQYNSIVIGMTRRQIAAIPPDRIASLYKMYCSDTLVQGTTRAISTETRADFARREATSTVTNLMCDLENKNFSDREIPPALYQIGQSLTQAGEMDQSLAFYACAAEKYFDEPAMYRIAEVYVYGTDALKKQFPDAKLKTIIKPDLKEAYYWISVLFHTDSVQNTMSTATGDFQDRVIGLLDSLQQDSSLSDSDLISEERDAVAFVAQRYPQVVNDGKSVYNHSMRAMKQSLEAAQKDPSRIHQAPNDSSTYIVEPATPAQ